MDEKEGNLREYIDVLNRWKVFIFSFVIVSIISALIFNFFLIPKTYESQITFLVANPDITNCCCCPEGEYKQLINPANYWVKPAISTYSQILTNPSFLKRILEREGMQNNMKAYELISHISVTSPKDSNLIIVKVNFNDPETTYKIAKAISEEFVDFAKNLNNADIPPLMEYLEKEIKNSEKELRKKEKEYRDFLSEFISDILSKTERKLKEQESVYIEKATKLVMNELSLSMNNLLRSAKEYQDFLSSKDNITILTEKLNAKLSNISNYYSSISSIKINIEEKERKLRELLNQIAKESEFVTLKRSVADSPFLTQLINLDNPNFKELANLQMETTELNPVYTELKTEISELQSELAALVKKEEVMEKTKDETLKEIYAIQKQLGNKKRDLEKFQRAFDIAKSNYSQAVSHYKNINSILSEDVGGLIVKDPELRKGREELVSLKRELEKAEKDYEFSLRVYQNSTEGESGYESILDSIDIGGILALDPELKEKHLKYLALKRELSFAKDKYNLLVEDYNKEEIVSKINIANIKLVLEPIFPEKPVRPKKLFNIGVTFVGSLIVAIFISFVLDYFSKTLRKYHERV